MKGNASVPHFARAQGERARGGQVQAARVVEHAKYDMVDVCDARALRLLSAALAKTTQGPLSTGYESESLPKCTARS